MNSPARSQDNHIYAYGPEPEKIYLQLEGKVYTTDKTIWFKAIVTNASDHNLTKLSGVLYVELIGPNEKIIEKKLIKLENGIGTGFFDLNNNYSEGTYLIRAYTEWDRNFGTDFFFNEYIQVFAPTTKTKPEPISKVTLVEKKDKKRQLIAYFDPTLIDSLHKKELTLIITRDKIVDTLSVEKNGANKYMIDYEIPDSCQFVTLKMLTKNLFSFTKTIVLDEDHLDLQFFPESGELVHGICSRVGFKALEYNGKGKRVSGEIINGKGAVFTRFKSNKLGMGSFIFNNPNKDSIYFARLKSQTDSNLSSIYPLPKVSPQGNVLTVIRSEKVIHITASSSYLKSDSIYIKVSCRGLVYYEIKGKLKDGVIEFPLPVNKLPDGIIAFTMMDNSGHPLAERLAFNERLESRLNIAISPDKDTCTQRDLTKLNIATTDNIGKPVSSNLSLLVFNKDQMGSIQSTRLNILSYFLLSSDLKGEIENPGFYFSKDKDRYSDLDALLLTQGWRKYFYTKPSYKENFQPESKLTISGSVNGIFSQKKRKEAELTLMTFGHHRSVQTEKTDTLGRFIFNINDEYGQKLNILLQSASKAGKNKDYTIVIDKKESPAIAFNQTLSIGKVDSVVHRLVEKDIERKKLDDTYKLSSGDIQLGEVVVEAYRMTPIRKKVMEEFGKPNLVISGKSIQEKEEKWSYGLYSVLYSKFPEITIHRFNNGRLIAQVRRGVETLVVVDGVPVNFLDYDLIPYIPPSEVSSFEIIKNAKKILQLYKEFLPPDSPLDVSNYGDVIAIYTYGGRGIYGSIKPKGLTHASVPVFSAPREFYAPKYENLQPIDWYKPDLRALIHWEPKVTVDSLGKASATFYNADIPGKMEVVVEAISEDGKIGYQELIYNVRKRDLNK
ncbi:MAG: hypothetical protein NTV31_03760 [Bacteroidia bacterium]|nr:hypothetical protein [Bacteroidia bacterium]